MPYEDRYLRRAAERRGRLARPNGSRQETGAPVRAADAPDLDFRAQALFHDQTDESLTGWETIDTMET